MASSHSLHTCTYWLHTLCTPATAQKLIHSQFSLTPQPHILIAHCLTAQTYSWSVLTHTTGTCTYWLNTVSPPATAQKSIHCQYSLIPQLYKLTVSQKLIHSQLSLTPQPHIFITHPLHPCHFPNIHTLPVLTHCTIVQTDQTAFSLLPLPSN